VAITVGYESACALLSDGTAKCWGSNDHGQLGDGTTTDSYVPVTVSNLTGAVAIRIIGAYDDPHACALLSDGTAKCWGNNWTGQLGDGTTTNSFVPVAVSGLSGAVAIALGYYHSCALLSDGTAKCWGSNTNGQLGDGTTTQSSTPVVVSGVSNVVAIAAGNQYTCVMFADGTAKCWGLNTNGQLGNGTTTQSSTPVVVSGLSNAVAIESGYDHVCVLAADGTIKCWGGNANGQLGDGTKIDKTVPTVVAFYSLGGRFDKAGGLSTIPISIPNPSSDAYFLRKYSAIEPSMGAAGSEEVTGASPSALFYTNDSYSTQTSTYSMIDGLLTIYAKDNVGEAIKITATDGTNAVTTDSITVNPAAIDHYTISATTPQAAGTGWPETVSAINTLGDVAVDDSTIVITVSSTSATAKFYTSSTYATENTLKQYTLSSGVVNIYIKDNSSGAITITATDGTKTVTSGSIALNPAAFSAYAITATSPQTAGTGWPETIAAQDIYGNTVPSAVNTLTMTSAGSAFGASDGNGLRKAVTISSPAALTDYQVKITADYESGMQADFSDVRFTDADGTALSHYRESYTASTSAVFWVKVPAIAVLPATTTIYMYYGNDALATASNGESTFVKFDLKQEGAITAKYSHTCALLSDGTAKCWGRNVNGQLGDGTRTDRVTPVAVLDLTAAVAIRVGGDHTCALLSDGTAKCWGYNGGGRLGDGSTSDSSVPVVVSGLSNAVAIIPGGYHTCALLSDGTVKCWGSNDSGQIGDGTTTNRYTPVSVSNLTGAVTIAVGERHSCVLLSDGIAKCWGNNENGRLGDGTTTNSSIPVSVSNLTSAVAIATGKYSTCALLSDGTAKCWGYNGYGQLGDGTSTDRYIPVSVSNLTSAVAIGIGYSHSCALLSDGTAKCWGYNGYGQLGDGDYGRTLLHLCPSSQRHSQVLGE
jgi:alpha-tubulin suppressor-like RCC1 family protein